MRSEIFHRFLFLLIKSTIDANKNGILIDSTLVSPHLLMIVCDQPQERKFLALKSAGTLRFCSLCLDIRRQFLSEIEENHTEIVEEDIESDDDSELE